MHFNSRAAVGTTKREDIKQKQKLGKTIGFSSSMNLLVLTTLRTCYLIIVSIIGSRTRSS